MGIASRASAKEAAALAETGQQREQRARISFQRAVLYAALIFYGVFSLAPFLFAFLSSFKTYDDVLTNPPTLVPAHGYTLANYQTNFSSHSAQVYGLDFPRFIFNSLV